MVAIGASVVLLGSALAATAIVASHTPSLRTLGGLPGFRDLVTAVPLAGVISVPPLSDEFLRDVLGSDLELFGDRQAGAAPNGSVTVPNGGVNGDGTGTNGTDTNGEGPTNEPAPPPDGNGGFRVPIPRFSKLDVVMGADRGEVEPGGLITYTITVTNVGTNPFQGELSIESHHPFWTVDATSQCGPQGVDPDPQDPCVAPAAPVPGTPSESVHTVRFSFGGLIVEGASMAFEFMVRVNPATPNGTVISNHAHMDVVGDRDGSKTTPAITVVVVQ
ncbi:MAG TPA: hypothetical protein VGA13_12240 [Acidimicrobiales bacterium]